MTNLTHTTVAALGALVLSTSFVAAAVGPAAATDPSPVRYVAAQVSTSAQANA